MHRATQKVAPALRTHTLSHTRSSRMEHNDGRAPEWQSEGTWNSLKYDFLTGRSFCHVVFYDNIVRPSYVWTCRRLPMQKRVFPSGTECKRNLICKHQSRDVSFTGETDEINSSTRNVLELLFDRLRFVRTQPGHIAYHNNGRSAFLTSWKYQKIH